MDVDPHPVELDLQRVVPHVGHAGEDRVLSTNRDQVSVEVSPVPATWQHDRDIEVAARQLQVVAARPEEVNALGRPVRKVRPQPLKTWLDDCLAAPVSELAQLFAGPGS